MIFDVNEIRKYKEHKVLSEILSYYKKEYSENYQGKPIEVLPYKEHKQVYITGNRTSFEKYYFDRRKRLFLLQALAMFDDSYLEDLEDLISAICEEYMWILPIHCVNLETKLFDKTEIDLFCSETALYLSETLYIFKDKLCPEIRSRIITELKERIIDNYESRTFKYETFSSNWASVCACGIGATYLLVFPDRFNNVKERLLKQFEIYLKSIDYEGYCYEGVNYWQYGFGFFCLFFSLYKNLNYSLPSFVKSEKVVNTVKYISRANMQGDIYLPFSDGGGQNFNINLYIMYIVKDLFEHEYDLPEKSIVEKSLFVYTTEPLFLHSVNGILKYGVSGKGVNENYYYYKKAEVFVSKKERYSFACKGGNNDELHNHNDVGAFQIVSDGKRLIADIGAGEYTCDYFIFTDEGRYNDKIFVCNSASHSVPIVNGKLQKAGKEYHGVVNEVKEDIFDIDLQNAYDCDIGLLNVKYVLENNQVIVKYFCKEIDDIVFRFITPYQPIIIDGELFIENMKCEFPDSDNISINEHTYSDSAAKEAKVYMLDYKVNNNKDFHIEFKFVFKEII